MSLITTNCTELDVVIAVNPSLTSRRELLVITAVTLCVIAALTFILNVIVIAAVCKSTLCNSGSTRAIRSGGNTEVVKLLMTSLAIADALVSLIIMPVRISEIVLNGAWTLPIENCKFRVLFSVYTCTVSIYHVMCMAVDRYLAVCRPLAHRLLTFRAGCIMAGVCWAAPFSFYSLPVLFDLVRFIKTANGCLAANHTCRDGKYDLFSVFTPVVSFYFPCSVIFFLYFRVLIKVRDFQKGIRSNDAKGRSVLHIYQIARSFNDLGSDHKAEAVIEQRIGLQSNDFQSTDDTSRLPFSNNKVKKQQYGDILTKRHGRKRKNKKALLSIGLIVITFTACWLPFAMFTEIFAFDIDHVFPLWSKMLTTWLGYFNSTLNPILFCFHRGIRADVKKLLCHP